MTIRRFLLFLLIFAAIGADAQPRHSNRRMLGERTDTMPAFVVSYVDSLRSARVRLDSALIGGGIAGKPLEPNPAYYKLFIPMTFYHDLVSNQFGISDSGPMDEECESALLKVYMRRPDLVMGTQTELDKAGAILSPSEESIIPDAPISQKVVSEAEIPSADVGTVDIVVKKPNFWTFSGDVSLQLTQNYVSGNWYTGGESNYNILGSTTLKANYNNKNGFTWENTLEMKLGLQSSQGDTVHSVKTSEDLLRYTAKVNRQATSKWSYSMQLIVTTQFTRSYSSNSSTVNSDFLSPITINPSIGMNYSMNWFGGRLSGSIYLAPLALTLTYCDREELVTSYGIDEGKHLLKSYGSEYKVEFDLKIIDNVTLHSRIYGNTSYESMRMEFENTLTMQVNKYLTCKMFVYPRFDDSLTKDEHHGYWHFKEWLSMGVSFSL